ncbi:hypothetical protein [Planctomicrobium piriforme]|uniref:Uncharacterized protein n=1 Tax=Planctomicrobium piriforme TaxID=1576369 RepID=A0A1I3G0L0_9PLAN|nr:hypothetical protein [Planctomicrobium piriforme]SFI16691.1 hypothetical protein SAMN05421753_106108 [Planctomicrobium piriforme]
MTRKILLILCAGTMLSVAGMVNISEAAGPRAAYNRGFRQGIRTVNRVTRPLNYGGYNRGYNRGYYGRGYAAPGVSFWF